MYKAALSKNEWTLCETAEQFAQLYPPHIEGHYMPQPWTVPHAYPCLIKEITTISNPNGPDWEILDFLYSFEEM